jgi:hypothetical protein
MVTICPGITSSSARSASGMRGLKGGQLGAGFATGGGTLGRVLVFLGAIWDVGL